MGLLQDLPAAAPIYLPFLRNAGAKQVWYVEWQEVHEPWIL